MQIQRMCTNYYVADYEVRLLHCANYGAFAHRSLESHFTRDFANCRITRNCK